MSDTIRVLFIEDDEDVRHGGMQALSLAGIEVEGFEHAERVKARIVPGAPVVVLSDVKLPGMSGLELLARVVEVDRELPVILVTGHGDISMAVGAMRQGAYDFVEKPFSSEHLVEVVRRAVEKRRLTLEVHALRERLENWQGIEAALLGRSQAMERIRRTILNLADTDADVLIYGETGTGKEMVARCLHDHGARRGRNFVALNCGGLPESLFESEIFGHVAGAFTGAARARIGKLEHADGGTLFLDEVESMPLALQVKLLRVLQERRIERLGSNEEIPVNVRVVAAAKADLAALARRERFRDDLYYRLNVAVIELPPLRERREDIPLLFEHFVLLAAARYGRAAAMLDSAQLHQLMAYAWPGNVRELKNIADRFVLGLLGDPFELPGHPAAAGRATLAEQVERFERNLIEEELRRHHGQAGPASEVLGLPKKTLYDKMRRYGMATAEFRS